jgi:hypothetical protein
MRKITILDEEYNKAQMLDIMGSRAADAALSVFESKASEMAHKCYEGMTESALDCPGFFEVRNDPTVKFFLSEKTAKALASKVRSGFGETSLEEAIKVGVESERFLKPQSKDDFGLVEAFYRGADIKSNGSGLVVTKSKIGAGSELLEGYDRLRSDLFCMMQSPTDYDEPALKNVLEGLMIICDVCGVNPENKK